MTYTPDLAAGITESFFQHIERLAHRSNAPLVIKKRITAISIELIQNIQRHGIDTEAASVTIEKNKAHYSIKSINNIRTKDIKTLSGRILAINKLDVSELKNLHTKILSKASVTEKGGVGLGLYRIAIRSAKKFIYGFHKINNNVYSFSLQINITTQA